MGDSGTKQPKELVCVEKCPKLWKRAMKKQPIVDKSAHRKCQGDENFLINMCKRRAMTIRGG